METLSTLLTIVYVTCCLFLGFVVLSYLTFLWLQGFGIGDRPLLFLGILLIFVGLQLFTTGLVAEMIAHSNSGRVEDQHVRKFHS